MMLLFRSTFITAVSASMIALCAFSMCASAAPQAFRPTAYSVLDEVPDADAVPVVPVPNRSSCMNQEDDPGPDCGIVDIATLISLSATSTSSMVSAVASVSASSASVSATNGASRSFCGGMSVALGVSLSVVWLVF